MKTSKKRPSSDSEVKAINKALMKKRNNPDEKDKDVKKINKSLSQMKNIISVCLITCLITTPVLGNDFCLVSKQDDRKILISNGKDNGVNSVDRFTIFSSTNRDGTSLDGYVNSEKYHKKEMLECFSAETPSSLFPTQFIEPLDPYWEGSVKDVVFLTSYCLVNDHFKSEPPNFYQHHKRTDYQIVVFHPNSEEDSWDESVNLSVRSVSGLCGISSVGTTNELNDDQWKCNWDDQLVWADQVCDIKDWKKVHQSKNLNSLYKFLEKWRDL